ncbi:SDR family NAD(P)-dependent oxidoreductase [Caenispirillum bisanense]|uniref:Short-chain dehydrogenase n=1 Tax=Caenispirillum bisanense TaxID=414052 RepID=A0A286G4K0_9PROT|nr:SDR family NAD(P)-dependent oxidoreductase [Caenispirillum bisanense]SOD90480.1 Short-chain dehydrogenase [Caenispirillum bisanense]
MFATAWVTGASSGIGRATALRLAAQGVRVAASARSEAKLAELALEAERLGGSIATYPLDVTDLDACRTTVRRIEAGVGPVDLALFVAGTDAPMGGADYSAETAARVMAVNYQGTANCLDAVLPVLRERRHGRIGVTASVAGYRGFPGFAAYSPSKAALIALCESLHGDLRRDGIRLSVINPWFVRTPLSEGARSPVPFAITPERAAREIVRGLQRDCFEILVPPEIAGQLKAGRALPDAVYLPLSRVLGAVRSAWP